MDFERCEMMSALLRKWIDLVAEDHAQGIKTSLVHSLTTSDGRELLLKTHGTDEIEICAPVSE